MSLKRALARAAGGALRSAPLEATTGRFFARHASIVFYHGIWRGGGPHLAAFGGYALDDFRRDIAFLSKRFRFASLDEALAANRAGTPGGEATMTVCFDDGHAMAAHGGLDVMAEYGVRATIFVITSCIGNARLMWMHKLSAVAGLRGHESLTRACNAVTARRGLQPISAWTDLPQAARGWPADQKDDVAAAIWTEAGMPPEAEFLEEMRPYMTWDDLRDWIARGHGVGLHTHTHPFCSTLTQSDLDAEFVRPAAEIRAKLGLDDLAFAYPFGDRLADPDLERRAFAAADLSCMLGVEGLSPLGTDPVRLERVEAEAGLDARLFARPIYRALFPGRDARG